MRRYLLIVTCALANIVHAATFYVATNGLDAANAGTQAQPFRTIGFALPRLNAGDTLIVSDGIYENQANFINDGLHALANGTATAPITIRAQNPYRVRIRNTVNTNYYDSPLRLRGNYQTVDGFIFELRDGSGTPHVGEVGGSYNRVLRSIFKLNRAVDAFGGWMYIGGHHHLIEDVGGVGAARYGFSTGGPTDDSHHIIFRRVVGRFDFSSSRQPKATFNAYGTDANWGVHHVLYQNCIALDGQRGPSGSEEHYGAWYFPKNMDAAWIKGSIALNNRTAYSGLFVQELQGRGTVVDNTVSWGNDGAAVRWNGTGSASFNRLTLGAHSAALYNDNSTLAASIGQSFFSGNTALFQTNTLLPSFTGNAFFPVTQSTGMSPVTPSGALRYLPDASVGTGLSNIGAQILFKLGRSGTVWDEPGFDELGTESLWPWPYEDELKAVFAETNVPAAGNTPSSNNTIRGLTVATDAYGKPMTLTRYIWQYLGNEIPAGIYTPDSVFKSGFE
jgi:hypothetical protein